MLSKLSKALFSAKPTNFHSLKPMKNIYTPATFRQIFTKGTDLEKKSYDQVRAEEEQLLTYYQNHMGSGISQEERAEVKAKVLEILAKHTAQDLGEDEDDKTS